MIDDMPRNGPPVRGAFSLIGVALAYASSKMQERVRGIAGYHSEGIDKEIWRPEELGYLTCFRSAHVHAVLILFF